MSKTYLPTKNNLLRLKKSIKDFKNGEKLLEEKKVILKKKMDLYIKQKEILEGEAIDCIKNANLALREAAIDVGFDCLIDISNSVKEDCSIGIKYVTLMGVDIPSVISEETNAMLSYGLYHTTISVDETIQKFMKVKEYIIKIAELDNTIIRLKKAIEKVEKRSNALKEIIIPRNEILANKISNSLEEMQRDEFVRLKVVKNNSY